MSSPSVLHISTADNLGGSARSAYKIHRQLCRMGVDSKMLVGIQVTSDPKVDRISKRFMKLADTAAGLITEKLGLQYIFYPSSIPILFHPWYKNAQVIQIYNTHGNYFSHSMLPFISRKKKIVWRLSDMWAATGHCAYSYECDRWMTGCRKCPDLGYYPPITWDSASLLWKWKRFLYKRSRIHIVAPSSWTRETAEASPILREFPISFIPNGVDLEIFKPLPKEWCRTILNIPSEKKVLLFLAHVIRDNPRKGGDFFIQAVNKVVDHGGEDVLVMLVGEGVEEWGHDLKCQVWRHGFINDDELLSVVYNSADIIVHPAVVENLPNSVIEAMACGKPSVAFDTGGVSDVVKHMETGYLAKHRTVEELVAGINLLLRDQTILIKMGQQCRETAKREYSVELQAKRFAGLYREIISANNLRKSV
jgi:glycosyltransferase involved in cell wall biosynthesis